MDISFPNESTAYRQARNALLQKEIELRREMEAVAVARRALPLGGEIPEDYVFDGLGKDGKAARIKMSELFRPGTDSLLIYNYMFPRHKTDTREAANSGATARLRAVEQPCPSCTALIDQLNAATPHFEAGGGNFVIVAKTSLENLLGVARDRGWQYVRLLSSANNNFRRDYHGEDAEGQQQPMMTAFKRELDGTIRFFWASELMFAPSDPGQDPRAAGTIEPFWNMFDLTPGGRPNFNEQLQYDCCKGVAARALKEIQSA
jgi:predicted dithiol-disulfide oxidoreductase (DUF899 family)